MLKQINSKKSSYQKKRKKTFEGNFFGHFQVIYDKNVALKIKKFVLEFWLKDQFQLITNKINY